VGTVTVAVAAVGTAAMEVKSTAPAGGGDRGGVTEAGKPGLVRSGRAAVRVVAFVPATVMVAAGADEEEGAGVAVVTIEEETVQPTADDDGDMEGATARGAVVAGVDSVSFEGTLA